MPKNLKGGPFWIYEHTFCCEISKNSKGGPFGDIKNFRKKSHSAIKRGPFRHVRFCRFPERGKERGERKGGLSLPRPDLALGGFRIVSRKWTDQCEDCSLKKKSSLL